MKFELDGLPDYSDEALLAELRRVAALVGKDKLTVAEFSKRSKINVGTLRRRFGSWPGALDRAGLSYLCNVVTPARKSRTLARKMTNEQIIEEIRRVAQVTSRPNVTTDDLRQYASIGTGAIRNRFGSLKAAIRAAGLCETAHGRRYTDDECFENLLRVWTYYGRPPMHREMKLPPSEVGPKAYIQRWGTWRKALYAFVDRANHDTGTDVQTDEESTARVHIKTQACELSKKSRKPDSEVREIRLGLRYQILKRDRFRCVLCGRSPATVLGLELHVDHIVPISQGGKSVPENLRSTCSECNIGKGPKREGG